MHIFRCTFHRLFFNLLVIDLLVPCSPLNPLKSCWLVCFSRVCSIWCFHRCCTCDFRYCWAFLKCFDPSIIQLLFLIPNEPWVLGWFWVPKAWNLWHSIEIYPVPIKRIPPIILRYPDFGWFWMSPICLSSRRTCRVIRLQAGQWDVATGIPGWQIPGLWLGHDPAMPRGSKAFQRVPRPSKRQKSVFWCILWV